MKQKSLMLSLGTIAIFFAVSACSHHQTPPVSAQGGVTNITSTSVAAPHPKLRHDIVVSDEIGRACRLDLDNITEAPKFDFDQSILSSDDAAVLNQVAQCMTTGPLHGRTLTLVGRADPRGEAEYNMTLGSSRASAVSGYLQELGMTQERLLQTSRGKMDATGTDEASWKLDRRVDLNLNP